MHQKFNPSAIKGVDLLLWEERFGSNMHCDLGYGWCKAHAINLILEFLITLIWIYSTTLIVKIFSSLPNIKSLKMACLIFDVFLHYYKHALQSPSFFENKNSVQLIMGVHPLLWYVLNWTLLLLFRKRSVEASMQFSHEHMQ